MPLAACQELVGNSLDLSSVDGVVELVQLIEGAIDCSSLAWVWGLSHPVLAGMIFGGLGFGVLKRLWAAKKKKHFKGKGSRKAKKTQMGLSR
jgi:hypothetical protein